MAGGLAFGAIFVANWQALAQRPEMSVTVPVAGQVSIGALSGLPRAVPNRIAEVGRNPSAAVVTLLPEWQGTERINILLLGIDRREDEQLDGTRSDTMMLVSIDPVQKSAAMVSLPRDLWVPIPGYGEQRINAAHAFGGPELAKKTVSADFGLPVRYYARVDFRGFEDLVNAIGGVIVDVDQPVKDDEYPTPDYGYQRIYISPGPQLMDGQTALYYARSRHNTSDFSRAARQQRVMLAMRDRAINLNMLPRAPELIGRVQDAVSTDLSTRELLALARLSSEIARDRIESLVVDTELARPFRGPAGEDLLLPDTPAIRREIDRALKAASRPELRARIEILNGSGRQGYGGLVGDFLSAQGFDVVRIAAADRDDYARTTLQVLAGSADAAEALRNALKLPASAVTQAGATSPKADLRLLIGKDYTLPAAR